jgi:hypothetical protein
VSAEKLFVSQKTVITGYPGFVTKFVRLWTASERGQIETRRRPAACGMPLFSVPDVMKGLVRKQVTV